VGVKEGLSFLGKSLQGKKMGKKTESVSEQGDQCQRRIVKEYEKN